MTKLCARGKSAAKRKFKVYPSAYANAYASKICAGKIKDPSGTKRKDWGPKKANTGKFMKDDIKKNDALSKDRRDPNRKPGTKVFDIIGDILKTPYIIRGGKTEKKEEKKKKKKNKNDNNIDDLPRGLQIDTTTDSSGSAVNKFVCGGEARGTGAAIKGKGFKGVF